MFNPKCYTLKNQMYDPKKEIIIVREQIRDWVKKLENNYSILEFNSILDIIIIHINDDIFLETNLNYYEDSLEGWKYIKHRNQLEKDYPKIFKQVVNEEKKQIRETLKMLKEDKNI